MAVADSIRSRRKGNLSLKKSSSRPARSHSNEQGYSKDPKARKPADVLRKRKAERPYVSPTHAIREIRAGVSITALHEIRARLGLINSTAIVVGYALKGQNCLLDGDAADVLKRHVSDPLFGQILNIDRLLGEDVDQDDGEDEGGAE